MNRIYREQAVAPARIDFTDLWFKYDGADNLIVAFIKNDGGDAWGSVNRYTNAGHFEHIEDVHAPFKADGISCAQSGDKLAVGLVTHSHGALNETAVYLQVLPGVCVPYPPGRDPDSGMGNPFIPGSGEGGGMTLQELVDNLNNADSALSRALRPQLKDRSQAAIRQEGVLTLANVHDSDGLFRRFQETTQEELKKGFEGLDDYTAQTRDALKALINEVLDEREQP